MSPERRKVLSRRKPPVRINTLENQSGTNLRLCGNVGEQMRIFPQSASQPVSACPSLARSLARSSLCPPPHFSPVSSSPLPPPPSEPHEDLAVTACGASAGHDCLTAPCPTALAHLSPPQQKHTGHCCQHFPPMFSLFLFSLAFLPLQSFVYSALCSVWQHRARKNPHNHTHTHRGTTGLIFCL